ncbi:MAG: methionine synthase [bacterium]
MEFFANALATGIGSLPHTESREACELVFDMFPALPYWPQLAKRSYLENMYIQYCENMAGEQLKDEGVYIQSDAPDFMAELEQFYESFISEDLEPFAISKERAEGFHTFLTYEKNIAKAKAIKGQITGPISFGLQVTDTNKRSILYDENLKDVLIKQLMRKAQWQIDKMSQIHPCPILFMDEPYLSSFGSAYINISREEVISSFEQILSELNAITGIHCCGRTDWSLLLDTSVNILSFDAYNFMDSLFLYKDSLIHFLNRGGIIAWGIVPTNVADFNEEDSDSLLERLTSAFKKLTNFGFDMPYIVAHSLITPSCGLGTLSVKAAHSMLKLTSQLSSHLRRRHGLTEI